MSDGNFVSVQCPVCDGDGLLEEKYDVTKWEPVFDPLSGYYGYEMRNVHTGEVVLATTLAPNTVQCFNCEGTGILEFVDE